MASARAHPLAAILCVVAFLLARGGAMAGLVLCEGSHGQRVEWGCERTPDGGCPHSDDHEQRDEGAPGEAGWTADESCRDTPVGDRHAGLTNWRPISVDVPAPEPLPEPLFALTAAPSQGAEVRTCSSCCAERSRGPTDRLRTVILRL